MARTQKQKAAQTHAVSLVTLTNPSSPIAEQYRTIRTNIQFASAAGQQIKTIVVTSSGPGEGKSDHCSKHCRCFCQIWSTGAASRCRLT
ncbi:hypothetical protein HMPREF9522_01039 [Enterococcus faecium TX0082]|nr:hypothetical protein HMPREF9522_01039 [Enterococcus faecium TX0082]